MIGSCYVYPNPAEEWAKVRFFLNRGDQVKIEILDIAGRTIGRYEPEKITVNEYNEISLEFRDLAPGVYIARIEARDRNKRQVKLVKFAIAR